MTPGQLNHWTLNQVEGSYAGWLGASLMLKPVLSSADGHQRRKRQLDSLRTSQPGPIGLIRRGTDRRPALGHRCNHGLDLS
jgi:hypothetical protein